MVRQLAKPGKDILASLTPEDCHAWHMASCLVGEVGELIEAMRFERQDLMEELGDMEFYICGLRQGYNLVREIPVKPDKYYTNIYVGVAGAAAEVFDVVKKAVIYRKPFNQEKLFGALNALDWWLGKVYFEFTIDRQETLLANVVKLTDPNKGRYKEGTYSDQAAIERNDKKEVGDA